MRQSKPGGWRARGDFLDFEIFQSRQQLGQIASRGHPNCSAPTPVKICNQTLRLSLNSLSSNAFLAANVPEYRSHSGIDTPQRSSEPSVD